MCGHVHLSAVPTEAKRGHWISLELELNAVGSLLKLVVGNKPWSPERTVCALGHGAISLALWKHHCRLAPWRT